MMRRRRLLWIVVAIVATVLQSGCRAAAPAQETPITGGREASPITAAPISGDPPDVDNDAPAGVCENTANLLSRVDRARGLFRATALDNRVGSNDGDGILAVRFVVIGEGINYAKDETTAPYCIFGGNESDCGAWPRDEDGFYTWGLGGPAVRPGIYQVFVEVFGEQVDSLSGRDRCEWNFTMRINEP